MCMHSMRACLEGDVLEELCQSRLQLLLGLACGDDLLQLHLPPPQALLLGLG